MNVKIYDSITKYLIYAGYISRETLAKLQTDRTFIVEAEAIAKTA